MFILKLLITENIDVLDEREFNMFKAFLPLFFLIFLTSCLEDQALQKEVVDAIGNLPITERCDLRGERFKKILDEVIQQDINCLKKNLNRFTSLVRRKNDRFIHQEELSKFINKFFKTNKDDILDSLDMLFKIVGLTLQTPKDNLDVNHIEPLTDFLLRSFPVFGLRIAKIKNLNKFFCRINSS